MAYIITAIALGTLAIIFDKYFKIKSIQFYFAYGVLAGAILAGILNK